MNTIDFASLLARIVENSVPLTDANDKPIECSRLNTFAVIQDQAQMQAENIGKTADYKQKAYFYSRKWSLAGKNSNDLKWEFPALFMWEGVQSFSDAFDSSTEVVQVYTLAISDKMPVGDKDCKGCGYCEKRDVEQVVGDLRTLGKKLLATLAQFNYYELYLSNVLVGAGWYTQSEVQAMETAGDIDMYNSLYQFSTVASGVGGNNTPIEFEVITSAYTQDTATLFTNIQLTYEQCLEPFELQAAQVIKPIKNVGCCG